MQNLYMYIYRIYIYIYREREYIYRTYGIERLSNTYMCMCVDYQPQGLHGPAPSNSVAPQAAEAAYGIRPAKLAHNRG